MAPDPGQRIHQLRHRIDSIRLALDATGVSADVREVLLAMLDEAELNLRRAAQIRLPDTAGGREH